METTSENQGTGVWRISLEIRQTPVSQMNRAWSSFHLSVAQTPIAFKKMFLFGVQA
jgi:hypothetical protein